MKVGVETGEEMTPKANAANTIHQPSSGQRARLLPYNHKVRHLQGLSLRNINLGPPSGRERGKTVDDETIPSTFRSPVKFLSAEDRNKIVQSRSHDNLTSLRDVNKTRSATADAVLEEVGTLNSSSVRPRKPRRRSTLEWANTTAFQRQESIRDAVARHTADVFFSFHVSGVEDPIYISEVVEQVTNPNFRAFDLRACSSYITRRDDIEFRLWARSNAESSWQLLKIITVNLPGLQFIGKSLEDNRHILPDNSPIFQMVDGLYIIPVSPPTRADPESSPLAAGEFLSNAQPTSSYDALMRLATLDECIQDAIAAQVKITSEINQLLDDHDSAFFGNDRRDQSKDDLARVERAVAEEKRAVKVTRARVHELRNGLQKRRTAIISGRTGHERTREDIVDKNSQLERNRKSHVEVQDSMLAQRRRICSELSYIFPIDPIPDKALAFKICNLSLPNSSFSDVNEDRVSAALGHVAHLVHLLALYLSIPLPYPISSRSSTSTIKDPISIMTGSRTFPLYLPRAVFYRFEYGVFLLNKNVELIASRLGLRTLDIRQTLPNLKYVLYVATAGKGELPTRKVGGVRGLMTRHILTDSPSSSRMSSPEGTPISEVSLRKQIALAGGFGNGQAKESQKMETRKAD